VRPWRHRPRHQLPDGGGIVDVARERFGWSAPDLDELVTWSDVIDAARFGSADEACSFAPAHMQIAAVVQEQGDDELCRELIPLLTSRTLSEIAALPIVAGRLAPIRARHEALAKRMAQQGEQRGSVAWFDLSEAPVEAEALLLEAQKTMQSCVEWIHRREMFIQLASGQYHSTLQLASVHSVLRRLLFGTSVVLRLECPAEVWFEVDSVTARVVWKLDLADGHRWPQMATDGHKWPQMATDCR
jgi:hypothetical protein